MTEEQKKKQHSDFIDKLILNSFYTPVSAQYFMYGDPKTVDLITKEGKKNLKSIINNLKPEKDEN